MIVDLSFPAGHSMTNGIFSELCSLSYALVDDAVEHIRRLGHCTQLVNMDLRDAYRIVPIHPHDHSLLAISWQGRTYVDHALTCGLRSAPKLFSAVADTIGWVLHCLGCATSCTTSTTSYSWVHLSPTRQQLCCRGSHTRSNSWGYL